MRAGKKNSCRSLCGLTNIHDIHADTVSRMKLLRRNLLLLVEHTLRLQCAVLCSEVDGPVAADLSLHNAGHHSLHLINKVVINCIALFLADLLKNDILRNLSGNASKGLAVKVNLHNIADFTDDVLLLRLVQRNLVLIILHIVLCGNNRLLCPYVVFKGFAVHFHLHVIGSAEVALAGDHECGFNGVKKSI